VKGFEAKVEGAAVGDGDVVVVPSELVGQARFANTVVGRDRAADRSVVQAAAVIGRVPGKGIQATRPAVGASAKACPAVAAAASRRMVNRVRSSQWDKLRGRMVFLPPTLRGAQPRFGRRRGHRLRNSMQGNGRDAGQGPAMIKERRANAHSAASLTRKNCHYQ